MRMRERPGGELLWTLNSVLCGADGNPMTLQAHMGWGSRSTLVGDGGCFLDIPYLIREMGPILDSGIMCGVET